MNSLDIRRLQCHTRNDPAGRATRKTPLLNSITVLRLIDLDEDGMINKDDFTKAMTLLEIPTALITKDDLSAIFESEQERSNPNPKTKRILFILD